MVIVVDAKVIDKKEYSFIPQIFIEGLVGWDIMEKLTFCGGETDNE